MSLLGASVLSSNLSVGGIFKEFFQSNRISTHVGIEIELLIIFHSTFLIVIFIFISYVLNHFWVSGNIR